MWDPDARYSDDMGESYCRQCVTETGRRCEGCPRPPLLPEAQTAVAAYLVCATQWRFGGMGSRTGLDYAACKVALETHNDTDPPAFAPLSEVLQQLQIIERAMLECDREAAERDRANREAGRHDHAH